MHSVPHIQTVSSVDSPRQGMAGRSPGPPHHLETNMAGINIDYTLTTNFHIKENLKKHIKHAKMGAIC